MNSLFYVNLCDNVEDQHLRILDEEFDEIMLLWLHTRQKQRKNRKLWVTPFRRMHSSYNIPSILTPHLSEEEYKQYFRITRSQFDEIHNYIKDDIKKQYTFFRQTISTRERVAVTLRFLATGHSLRALSFEFRLGASTISKIIREVCASIWCRMQPVHMPVPTLEKWMLLAQEFESKWHFPNCLGSIDGKHVWIVKPLNSGSEYFNYKQHFSIVLMAAADANYKFIFIDVGIQGSVSDGYSFAHSSFGQNLQAGTLNLPEDRALPGCTESLPYVFVADAAFPLQQHIMRPYPATYTKNTIEPRIFNYRLSRARQTIECAFGILAARFGVYKKPMALRVNTVNLIVKATCVLHNFLRSYSSSSCEEEIPSFPSGSSHDDVDMLSNQLTSLNKEKCRASKRAFQIRDKFSNYFNGEGSVPWQMESIKSGKF